MAAAQRRWHAHAGGAERRRCATVQMAAEDGFVVCGGAGRWKLAWLLLPVVCLAAGMSAFCLGDPSFRRMPAEIATPALMRRAGLAVREVTPAAREGVTSGAASAGLRLMGAAAAGATLLLARRRRRSSRPEQHRIIARRSKASEIDNVAFVFVKPHACTPAALKMVPEFLHGRGIQIEQAGQVAAADMLEGGIIDAHYASIAEVGMATDLAALNVSAAAADRFAARYGVSFQDAVAAGRVHSAATALEALGVSPAELLTRCMSAGYEKLGSGLYAAQLEMSSGHPMYVLNGFYARMREKFTTPGAVVHWFIVRFKTEALSWQSFRREVVGATNPAAAAEGSLRAKFRDEWCSLGLQAEPDGQDNGVHASAGPLEALRERILWTGSSLDSDTFGAALASRGLSSMAGEVLENAEVELRGGRRGRIFDLLEDIDTEDALAMLSDCSVIPGTH